MSMSRPPRDLIDDSEAWIANNTIFIQVGDLIHRREQNAKVVQKLFEYQTTSLQYNSMVALVMGNHDYEQIKLNPEHKHALSQSGPWCVQIDTIYPSI